MPTPRRQTPNDAKPISTPAVTAAAIGCKASATNARGLRSGFCQHDASAGVRM